MSHKKRKDENTASMFDMDVVGMMRDGAQPKKSRSSKAHIEEIVPSTMGMEYSEEKEVPLYSLSSSSSSSSSPSSPPHYSSSSSSSSTMRSTRVLAAAGDGGWGGGAYPALDSGAAPTIPGGMDAGYPSGNWTGMASGGFTPGMPGGGLYTDANNFDDHDDPSVIPHHYLVDNGQTDQHLFEQLPSLIKQFGFMNRGLYFTFAKRTHRKSNPAELVLPIQLVNLWLLDDGGRPFSMQQFPTASSVLSAFKLVGPCVAQSDNPDVYINQQKAPQYNNTSMTIHTQGWTETPNLAMHSDHSVKTAAFMTCALRRRKIDPKSKDSRECWQFEEGAVDRVSDAADLSLAASCHDGSIGVVQIMGYINGNATTDDYSQYKNARSSDAIHHLLLCPVNRVDACIQEQGYLPKVFYNHGLGFARNLGLYRRRCVRQPLNIFTAFKS